MKKLSLEQMENLHGGSLKSNLICGLASAAYGAAIGGAVFTVIATGGAAAPAIIALAGTVGAGLTWGASCYGGAEHREPFTRR